MDLQLSGKRTAANSITSTRKNKSITLHASTPKSYEISPLNKSKTTPLPFTKSSKSKNFHGELALLAEKYAVNKTLLISVIDSAYINMALNFWESSLVKFGITNYLFICMNEKAKRLIPSEANECLVINKNINGVEASPFGSRQFNKKVMIKTELSLILMQMGYIVIISDVDIVFLHNPMPYLKCNDCDLIIQDNTRDNSEANSGFYLIKPTKSAMELQQRSIERAKSTYDNDQNTMNWILSGMRKNQRLKVIFLDYKKFLPGNVYFNPHDFANDYDCSECVMVHNNWIVGLRPKIYRFKEMGMWVVDKDGYYSSNSSKYLTYGNPSGSSRNQERAALDLAFKIAHLLGRIVILPKFNCGRTNSKKCNLLRAFGPGYLLSLKENAYRESEFLKHPKVPLSTRQSQLSYISLKMFQNVSEVNKDQTDIIKSLTANKTLMSHEILLFETLIL